MLLKKEHVTKAMQLTTGDVRQALQRSGYTDPISAVTFMGMTTSGSFVYDVSYINIDTGHTEDGAVFVYYSDKGLLHADY